MHSDKECSFSQGFPNENSPLIICFSLRFSLSRSHEPKCVAKILKIRISFKFILHTLMYGYVHKWCHQKQNKKKTILKYARLPRKYAPDADMFVFVSFRTKTEKKREMKMSVDIFWRKKNCKVRIVCGLRMWVV